MRLTRVLVAGSMIVVGATLTAASAREAEPSHGPVITVYHSPTCGCCKQWISYLEKHGFSVKSIEQASFDDVKTEAGITPALRSCHTALIEGYAIEGHVPAADIQRLLKERPKVLGLTAPGMPGASPGMDSGKDPYDVLTFDAKGKTTVWARH